MNLLSKETLIGAASLGAGAVIAKIVHTKVLPLVPVSAISTPNADKSASNIQNLITLAVGIATPKRINTGITVNTISRAGLPWVCSGIACPRSR